MRGDLRAALGLGRVPLVGLSAVLAIFLLLPLMIVIPTSWTAGAFLEFPPQGFSLEWYEDVLSDPKWTDALQVSLRVSLQASVLATVMGTAAALGVRRLMGARSSRFLRSVFILPLAIPYVAYALGIYNVFLELPAGLLDTTLPLVLALSLVTFPLVYIVASGALSGIDPSLARAASTLGARWPTIVWRIELPLIRPAIVGGWLFAFVVCFDEAVLAIFLAPVDQVTLAQQIFRSASEAIAPTLSAVSTAVTLLAILLLGAGTLFVRRAAAVRGRAA